MVTRPVFVLALFLSGAPAVAPEPSHRRLPSYEPPAWMMESITALLDASRRYGVDPVLAFKVAFQESRLKPWAKGRHKLKDGTWGPVLARGLMQISVQYQDKLVRDYLGWDPSNFRWDDPGDSAMLGCAYLAALVKRFGVWGAVCAYNCGPGRFNEWPRHRTLPAETWNHVSKILG